MTVYLLFYVLFSIFFCHSLLLLSVWWTWVNSIKTQLHQLFSYISLFFLGSMYNTFSFYLFFCWSTATKHYKECLFWSAIDVWVPVHVSTHRLCGTKNKIQKTTILFDKCIKIETKLKRNTKKCLANVMCDKRKQHTVRNWSISKTKNARMFVHE